MPINLRFRTLINAASRFISDKDFWTNADPHGKKHLLLVSISRRQVGLCTSSTVCPTSLSPPGNPGGNAKGSLGDDTFVAAATTPDGTLGIAYLPTATTITVNLTGFSGSVTAKWIDPSTGIATTISGSPFASAGSEQKK
jgi:Putative collagen-binding domain of a collagenase